MVPIHNRWATVTRKREIRERNKNFRYSARITYFDEIAEVTIPLLWENTRINLANGVITEQCVPLILRLFFCREIEEQSFPLFPPLGLHGRSALSCCYSLISIKSVYAAGIK